MEHKSNKSTNKNKKDVILQKVINHLISTNTEAATRSELTSLYRHISNLTVGQDYIKFRTTMKKIKLNSSS